MGVWSLNNGKNYLRLDLLHPAPAVRHVIKGAAAASQFTIMSCRDEDSTSISNSQQESELDELKFRISQLEHLVVSKTLDSSLNSSLPSSIIPSSDGLINRMNQLERLLAASELENSRLREEIDMLNVEIKKDHVEFEEILESRDKEILDLKYEVDLYLKKSENFERKLKNIEAYVNTLPSEEELTSANQKVRRLESENATLEQKLGRFEQKLSTLTKQLFHKESQYQDVVLKLDELKPFQEAQECLLDDQHLRQLDLADKDEVLKYMTVLKAQIERSKKIISGHRGKINVITEEKSQYIAKMNSQALLLNESREQYVDLQYRCQQLEEEIKSWTQRYTELTNKYEELKTRTAEALQSKELRAEQYESVIKLVTEIDFCVSEMRNAIEIGKRLLSGDEVDVDSLLGLTDFDFRLSLNDSDDDESNDKRNSHYDFSKKLDDYLKKLSKEGDLNLEWCLERWENVRKSRKELMTLRNQLKDFYVQKLSASGDGCPIQ